MFANDIPEHELKRLTDAITNAILNSKEAKKILAELYRKKLINTSMLMLLALNIQNIDYIKTEKNIKQLEAPPSQYIDGRKLTENQIAFRKYCNKDFDENRWLKEIGIVKE